MAGLLDWLFVPAHAENPTEPIETEGLAPSNEQADEDEEPEDTKPAIDEECKQSVACAPNLHHYESCVERVTRPNSESGKHAHGHAEDCAEELIHLMHCIDNCAAPKLFATLK